MWRQEQHGCMGVQQDWLVCVWCVTDRTVLLGQVHGKLVKHFSGVALQRAEKSAAAVDHDEAKLAVVGQQGRQRLCGGGEGWCGLEEQGKRGEV